MSNQKSKLPDCILHWFDEIDYALTGIKSHLNKQGFRGQDGFMLDGTYFSFVYLREKEKTVRMLLNTLKEELEKDKK